MKKMLLLATALFMGATIQAAQFNWQFTSQAADVGSTVYVLLGASISPSTTFSNMAAIDSLDIGSADIEAGSRSYATQNGFAKSDSISAEATSTPFYFVVAHADKGYWISGELDASVYENALGETVNYVYKDGASSPGTLAYKASADLIYTEFEGVPEPTALALLALGVAGVALRRKMK